jgi:hypothetical protein
MAISSTTIKAAVIALLAAAVAVGAMLLLFPPKATTAAPTGGPVTRLASFYDWSGEVSTSTSTDNGGLKIFDTNVFPPSNANALYITFSATGDTHNGSALSLQCLVNDHSCPTGGDGSDDWTKVQRFFFECPTIEGGVGTQQLECYEGDGGGGPGDWHDNNIHQTWCKSIKPGGNHSNVKLNMASDSAENSVYMENMTVVIDAAWSPHGCSFFDMGGAGGDAAGHGH